MKSALNETKCPAPPGRTKRSTVPVPITLSGVDKDGQSFREDSRTIVITRNGVLTETIHCLNLGMEITVENPALGRRSAGRVVWCGGEPAAGQVSEIGIYLADAEVVCGIELAFEENQHPPATQPDGGGPERLSANPSAQPDAAVSADPQRAVSPAGLPTEPLDRRPVESAVPAAHQADEVPPQEFDLTSELGQMETVPRGFEPPTCPALDEPGEGGERLAETGRPVSAPPLAAAAAPSATTQVSAEQLDAAVEAAVSLCGQRIGETVSVQSRVFEEKLELLAQQSVSQAQANLQALATGFEQKIMAFVEQQTAAVECRLREVRAEAEGLRVKLEHLQQASQTEITKTRTALEELGSQTVQFALEGVNEKLEAQGEWALSQFRNRSSQIVESECQALNQRVSSAGDFIRDWSEQATARLESYSETVTMQAAASAESLRKQSDQVAAGFMNKLQNDADVALGEALERAQQAAGLLEGTAGAMQERVQKGTQELVDTAAAQLQQLGQTTLGFVSEQLAESKKQFTTEASEALHHRFDELIEASVARLHKLTDDGLDLFTEQLTNRQKLLISDTSNTFRQKIGEMLAMLQNGSGENG